MNYTSLDKISNSLMKMIFLVFVESNVIVEFATLAATKYVDSAAVPTVVLV
tara:strand:+ start:47 stop:199 length:153 start_codon:yes stop_codon:yes gene_type:complete